MREVSRGRLRVHVSLLGVRGGTKREVEVRVRVRVGVRVTVRVRRG